MIYFNFLWGAWKLSCEVPKHNFNQWQHCTVMLAGWACLAREECAVPLSSLAELLNFQANDLTIHFESVQK